MDQDLGLALKLGVYAACYRSGLEGGGALLLGGWHTGTERCVIKSTRCTQGVEGQTALKTYCPGGQTALTSWGTYCPGDILP